MDSDMHPDISTSSTSILTLKIYFTMYRPICGTPGYQNQPILSLYIDQFDLQVSEPTYFVTYDIGFKRETYFDGSFGVLKKVKNILVFI